MIQDFTVHKKSNIRLKKEKNSCRGVHLKKKIPKLLWNYCTIKRKVILSIDKQKCLPLPPGSAVKLNKLNLIEIDLFVNMLYEVWCSPSSTRPWNKQISAPDAGQPSSQARWQVADLKHLKNSYIFSLPRISTKDFPYIKEKIDWSIGINYSSVDFKWTQVFLCCQSLIAEVNEFY